MPFEDLYARRDEASIREVDVLTEPGETPAAGRTVYRLGFLAGLVPGLSEQVRVGEVEIYFTWGPVRTQYTHVRQRFGTELVYDKSMERGLEVGEGQPLTVCQITSEPPSDPEQAMRNWRDEALGAVGLVAAVLDERVAVEEIFEDLIYLRGEAVVATADVRARVRNRLPFSVTDTEHRALIELAAIDFARSGAALASAARWYLRGAQAGPTADGVVFLWIAIEALTPARSTAPKVIEAMLVAAGWDPGVQEISVGRLAGLRADIVHGGHEDPELLRNGFYHLEAIARILIRYSAGIDSGWPAVGAAELFDEPFRTALVGGATPTTVWHQGALPSPEAAPSQLPTWQRLQPPPMEPEGTPTITVSGDLQPGWERRLRFWGARAARELDPALNSVHIEIGAAPGMPSSVEAAANAERILLRPELLRLPDPVRELRLGWLVHGEVAQHLVMRDGLRAEGLGALFIEAAGHFAQHRHFVDAGPIEESDLKLKRIEAVDLTLIGGHLGEALAGSTRSRQELDRWYASSDQPEVVDGIREIERQLSGASSFDDLRRLIAELTRAVAEADEGGSTGS